MYREMLRLDPAEFERAKPLGCLWEVSREFATTWDTYAPRDVAVGRPRAAGERGRGAVRSIP